MKAFPPEAVAMSDIRTTLDSAPRRPAVRVGGIVLAGGRSTRMGRPKAWLPVGERTMLETVVGAVANGLRAAAGMKASGIVAAPIVVVGAPGQDLPPAGEPVLRVEDDIEGEGPLRGMAAGLAILSGKAEAAYVSSCDVPLLKPAFVARLVALLGDADIAVPLVDERHHPLAAVYRLVVLETVRELLALDKRRPFFLFERHATRVVTAAELEAADPRLDSLRNFNTPQEYDRLLAGAGAADRPAGGLP
jgi:molybdenum cofactor guanylyltransferase